MCFLFILHFTVCLSFRPSMFCYSFSSVPVNACTAWMSSQNTIIIILYLFRFVFSVRFVCEMRSLQHILGPATHPYWWANCKVFVFAVCQVSLDCIISITWRGPTLNHNNDSTNINWRSCCFRATFFLLVLSCRTIIIKRKIREKNYDNNNSNKISRTRTLIKREWLSALSSVRTYQFWYRIPDTVIVIAMAMYVLPSTLLT